MDEQEQPPRALPVSFTASGSEYLRIWIVNLLLTVVTLGFYLPFAKARRLRYFYANTLIDGQPLAFHGDPWKLFRGFVLMGLLFAGYGASGHFSPWAALAMFVLLAFLWPALWRSSLYFRLHNSSWRGLRFGFNGTLSGAYLAILPVFVPGLYLVAANAWFLSGVDQSDPTAMGAAMKAQMPWLVGSLVLFGSLMPLALGLIKRYQHAGYRYANQQASFSARLGDFYRLSMKCSGVMVLLVLACGVVVAVAFVLLKAGTEPDAGAGVPSGPSGAAAIMGVVLFSYLLALQLMAAFYASRMQNLSWNATSTPALRFDSRLKARALALLLLKNLLLTVLTLGLYRPFAVVNVMRLRLSAVTIQLQGDIDSWQAGLAQAPASASGEMAGDFFGIDVGL